MDLLRTLPSRIASLFRRNKLEQDLDEELRAHIGLATEDNLKRGMSSRKARTAALRTFGGLTQAKEQYRVQRGFPLFEGLAQDTRFALRQLRKSWAFTATATITLALAIGGNTVIFSIVNGVLLDPLPFPEPDRLVTLHESKPNFDRGSISYPNFLDWQKDNRVFSAMAVARGYAFSFTGRGEAEQVNAEFISGDFFRVLGVQPILGRTFTAEEEQAGAGPVALISEGLWRRKLDSDPNILSRIITLDGRDYTVVGVIPAGFHLRLPAFQEQDIYAPIRQWNNNLLMNRGAGLGFHGIARLRPGVSLEQARADMDRVTRQLAAAFPDADHGIGASMIPLKEMMVGKIRPTLLLVLAAVGFVLLIACVNVASLLLARSAARRREFALRAALGASRGRIIRQLLTESLLLGLAAGGIGLLLAVLGTRGAIKSLPAALPRSEQIGLDFHVLLFTMAISLLVGILFGLAPALRSSQLNPQSALQQGGRGSSGTNHRALNALVVFEMAIALVLSIGAGLMVRSIAQLWSVNPGFNPDGVLNFGLSLPPSMTKAQPDAIRAALRAVDDKLASAPNIQAVSQTWGAIPIAGDDEQLFWLDGQPKPTNENEMNWAIDYIVEPDYLKVMQTQLIGGRFFTPQDDRHSPPVAVIDEVLAHKFFPNQNPIGKRIYLNNTGAKVEIVGVATHVKQWGLDLDDSNSLRAQLYLPCLQMPDSFISAGTGVVVRYRGSMAAAFDSIRAANRQMSSQQVIYGAQSMESVLSDSMADRRFAMILLGAFAALALVLASVGIYGVMAYLVGERTQEIGIRMALGAKRGDVLSHVLWRGARLTLIGAGLGIGATLLLTPLMRSLLFNVKSYDPIILASVCVLLVAVALAACFIPARRAASIDPMQALRTE